jgi:tetratricopeptide (TPR) repeat protein
MHAWELANRWALITLRPGEFPAAPSENRYVHAVTALEAAGKLDAASRFYTAALERWPDNTLAMFGLGNVYYAQGESRQAEAQYRRLLARLPDYAAARNNLAQLLADRGCRSAALTEIEIGLAATESGSPLRKNLLETRAGILDSPSGQEKSPSPCPATADLGGQ